jgi:HK97 gp10 family phage protein
MADEVRFDITGLSDLKATFESLATKEADRCVSKALMAGAAIEQAAITALAPLKDTTGGLLPDGALKSDITITRRRFSDGKPYVTVAPGKYTAHVAFWVEYGHRLIRGGYSKLLKSGKTRGPGTQIGVVPEHSFIRKAYEQSCGAVADAISSTLIEEITKSAAKGGKP